MPKLKCVDPKKFKNIVQDYNKDAKKSIYSPGRKMVTLEAKANFERHLLQCSYCRSQLEDDGITAFGVSLMGSGHFLEGRAQLQRQENWLKKLCGIISEERAITLWPEVTEEEWDKIWTLAYNMSK